MRTLALGILGLAACGGATPPGFVAGSTVVSSSATTSDALDAGTSSTGLADDSSDASGSTGTLRDVGSAMDFGSDQPAGCQGKVDLLFLISRSSNMRHVQEQLLASFPGFIDTIEERLAGFDVRIMAVNPDGNWGGQGCDGADGLCKDNYPNCGPNAEDYQCITFPDMKTKCDTELGAGLVFNVGYQAKNAVCDLYGGNRYIIAGEPDLKSAFDCIATVGTSGGVPSIGDALVAAMSWPMNGPYGCNKDFLRDDALLVVVLVANTLSDDSWNPPYNQHKAILEAKKDENAVVMLAVTIFPPTENEPTDPDCIVDDWGAGGFVELLEMFPHHLRGNACSESYVPFFASAIDLIDEACSNFIPR